MQRRGDSDSRLRRDDLLTGPAPASSRGPVNCSVLRVGSFGGGARYGFSTGSRTAFPHSVHDPS
jgi:hypothetical protein